MGAVTSVVGSSGEPPPSAGELRRRSPFPPSPTGAKSGWPLGDGRSGEVAGRGDAFEALGGDVAAVGVGSGETNASPPAWLVVGGWAASRSWGAGVVPRAGSPGQGRRVQDRRQ